MMNADSLLTLLSVVVVSSMGAMFTYWFEFLVGDPWDEEVSTRKIFSFYGVWVRAGYEKYEAQLKKDLTNMTGSEQKLAAHAARKVNYFMALGACPYCLNVWLSSFFGLAALFLLTINFAWLAIVPAISHLVLRIIYSRID